MDKIGFIGIGVMGNSMVKNLLKAEYSVNVFTRTKSKADEVVELGANWCGSIKECISDVDVVITIVGYPKDVEEVYFGEKGIIENVEAGTYIIDMTTTAPTLAQQIYTTALPKGIYALDAPVSGGDIGAKNATLTIMVGGDKEAFDRCLPIFKAMGTTIEYQGRAGNGQHTKMANQIAIAGSLVGTCEAIAYAKEMNLDLDSVLKSISGGSAGSWQLQNLGPKMLAEDLEPGFFLKHFVKDLSLAHDGVNELDFSMLSDVLRKCKQLETDGYADKGTQSLIKYY